MSNIVQPKGWGKPSEALLAAELIDLDDAGCSTTTLQHAEAKLAESGLSLSDAGAFGMFPADDASAIHPDFAAAPALVIPYLDAAGDYSAYDRDGVKVPFCRVRYLTAPGRQLPKDRRYDQAGASGTRPYFPRAPFWAQAAAGALDGWIIVEGELKAAALCTAGIPAVAIGGVDCFGDGAATALHPALATLVRQVPDVHILFDSDAAEKARVQAAEWRLAGQLALAGGRPHIVRLPRREDGEKVGADDYLVAHGADALLELINAAPAVGERPTAPVEAMPLSALLTREVQPVAELIPDWLEKGIPTLLCGPGGVHKSRLALQIGLCLNAGASMWGSSASVSVRLGPPPATLVYVAAEDDDNELARRSQAITRVLKLKRPKHDNALFLPRKGKDSALIVMRDNGDPELRPFYHELMYRLRSIAGHKLLVLDSAYDFARWQGHTKVNEDAVNFFIKVFLQGLCDEADCTILMPWHPSQAGAERGDMSGWSVAWHNAPRARLSLSRPNKTAEVFELAAEKRNHGRLPEPISLGFHEGALLPIEAVPDDGKESALRSAVVAEAIRAARAKFPFNRKDRIDSAILSNASTVTGRRVTQQDFKDALAAAVRAGELQFIADTRHRLAGFYPADEAEARELANAAKHSAREPDND